MDDGPRQRKERHLVALERQQPVAAHELAGVVGFERRVEHLRLELDDFVAPPLIRNPELQRLDARVGRDDRVPAERDRRGRPREAREEESRRQRLIHQADQRLDGDEHVRRESIRHSRFRKEAGRRG